ncbi:NUDIX domain-containing protein [Aquihabitans sp. G128]|uniref:NUDIX domain-containing protein n=1 Tax=Aquihabitans sp. G128 TaxID=2849779 RepID=UPI001C232240|nr:NUDIX domain-containing protein [Aquihabitans sp. G128]QXC63253.1 NUDIX domain-containing protein [Aquihabitans sp. G128]
MPPHPVDGDAGGRAASAAAEPVEVVGRDGTVERVVGRAEMRAGHLRHRCTYVVVVDAEERVVVHQRAAWKDVWPSRWDLAFGGVVDVGEGWLDAARRELAEEAGIEADLVEVATGTYDDDDVSLLGHVFVARHDGPFTFPDGEVVASDRVPLTEVEAWISGRPHCPDAVALALPATTAWIRPDR